MSLAASDQTRFRMRVRLCSRSRQFGTGQHGDAPAWFRYWHIAFSDKIQVFAFVGGKQEQGRLCKSRYQLLPAEFLGEPSSANTPTGVQAFQYARMGAALAKQGGNLQRARMGNAWRLPAGQQPYSEDEVFAQFG